MNNSIQVSIEPLSLRSAGYRGAESRQVDNCICLQSSDGPEKELATLESFSSGPLGKLGPVAGIVIHKTGRKYFYRGRTVTADMFYALRQPYYRAEVHCILISNHISQALDQGVALSRRGLEDGGTDSFANLSLILAWLNSCATHHPNCTHYFDDTAQLPSRVLDVGGMKDENVRLHISRPEERSRYIALSHRWGKTSPLTTTTKTLPDRVAGIPLKTLSQTFRDAIYVARIFDIKYLWIDSLCIIQDSEFDWKEQAAVMGSIYRRSFLTIAATDTEDTTSGLFFTRSPTKYKPCKIQLPIRKDMFAGETGSLYVVSPRSRRGQDIARPRGLLDTRAWVLQEQILSGRVLDFTKEQVYVECVSTKASEALPYDLDNTLDNETDYVSTLKYAIGGLLSQSESGTGTYLHQSWYLMVEDYSRRKLTIPADKWAAILGIVTELQRATGDICSFGIWRHWMAHDLLWSVYSPSYPRTSRRQNTKGPFGPNGRLDDSLSKSPSWSWLQIEGHISYLTDSYDDLVQDQVLVEDVEIIEAGTTADPSLEHKHLPRLRIREPLRPAIPFLRCGYLNGDSPENEAEGTALTAADLPDGTPLSEYAGMAELDLISSAADPTDDRATRTWRIASDLEEEIYGPKPVMDEEEPIIGTIPSGKFGRVIHKNTLAQRPNADQYTTDLYPRAPGSDLIHEQRNKYILATMVNKTAIGFWAPDIDGEVIVPKAEDLSELSEDDIASSALLFVGICRGQGWVRCLGLKLVGTGVDAMLANVWRRVGMAWILEDAWGQTSLLDTAEVILI